MVEWLASDTTLTGLVADRITPGVAKAKSALPRVTYNRVSRTKNEALDGQDPMPAALVQIDCWALTAAQAEAVADAVEARLATFPGSRSGWWIANVSLEDRGQDQEQPQDASAPAIYRERVDCRISYSRGA